MLMCKDEPHVSSHCVADLTQCPGVVSEWGFCHHCCYHNFHFESNALLIFPVRHAEPWETAERSHSSRAAQDSQAMEENPHSGRRHLQVAQPFFVISSLLRGDFKFCFTVSLSELSVSRVMEMLKCWCSESQNGWGQLWDGVQGQHVQIHFIGWKQRNDCSFLKSLWFPSWFQNEHCHCTRRSFVRFCPADIGYRLYTERCCSYWKM